MRKRDMWHAWEKREMQTFQTENPKGVQGEDGGENNIKMIVTQDMKE
jgi:hypothetical protein